MQSTVRVHSLGSAAQQRSIARADTQCGCVRCNIGAAFINDTDEADWNSNTLHCQAVRLSRFVDYLTNRVRQFRHRFNGRGDGL